MNDSRTGVDASPRLVQALCEQLQQTLHSSYTVDRKLGSGGMSRVFVVEEIRLRHKVVIKIFSPEQVPA